MWLFSARCESNARLDNKTTIVTGANSGIGKAVALELVRRGARVLMLCRDMEKAERALEEIRCQTWDVPEAGVALLISLNLASLDSVRKCAKHILDTENRIHLLINNAGVCLAPELYTEEGFEMHMGVNHFGHFFLTCLLLPRIIRSAPARIINVSSKMSFFAYRSLTDNLQGKKQSYSSWYAYAESKLANILFTTELSRRLQGTGVTTYSVHPGAVVTDAARWFSPRFKWFYDLVLVYIWKTPEQGAQTIIHCAVDEEASKENGLYYEECRASAGPTLGTDTELAQKLWEESVQLVALLAQRIMGYKRGAYDVDPSHRFLNQIRHMLPPYSSILSAPRKTMWSFAARCESKARLDKKTAIVTGSSSGIGKATALELVHRGARVLMACPDLAQAEAALQEIRCQTRDLPGAGVAMVVHLDLASLASVRKCAQYILDSEDHIHLLINNAGVCYAPELYTEDGFEMHLGVNYFGHFLLTCLLLPRIIRTGSARIINVSSKMAYFARKDFIDNLHGKKQSYSAWYGYAESKLAIILFTTELARRLQDTSVKTYALHPGSVATDAAHWFSPYMRWFYSVVLGYIFKTPEQGAQTTIHCAVDEEAGKETGLYYRNCSVSEPPALASDIELAQKLWEKSILLVGLEGWDPFKS